jgi:hypothetical protein
MVEFGFLFLSQDIEEDFAMNIGKSHVAAAESECGSGMV